MTRASRCVARALTLMEVIVSVAIMGILMGALLTFFWQTLAIRDQARTNSARTQIVAQVLDRMAAELRNTVATSSVGFQDLRQFVGERRRITFLTTPLPPEYSYAFYQESDQIPMPRHDLFEVTYELWIDPNEQTEEGDPLVGGLLRTERQAVDPSITEEEVPEGDDLFYIRRDLWSYEIGYLEFRYFDGVSWSTTWEVTEGNALPHLIQITVGFDSLKKEQYEDQDLQEWPIDQYPLGSPEPNPDRFSAIVRLPAADEMFSARLSRLDDEIEELYGVPVEEGEPEEP